MTNTEAHEGTIQTALRERGEFSMIVHDAEVDGLVTAIKAAAQMEGLTIETAIVVKATVTDGSVRL